MSDNPDGENNMPDVLNQKIGSEKISITDGLMLAGAKVASEMFTPMLPVVGQYFAGTSYRSGLVKIGTAIALHLTTKNTTGILGKATSIATTGILIDGCEDIIVTAKNQILGSPSAQTAEVPM